MFIGRKHELQLLRQLRRKETASLVIISGRRHIGKKRLITEFIDDSHCLVFTGLPPTAATTKDSQLAEFARQAKAQGMPEVLCNDWSDAFLLVAQAVKTGRATVVFDEISWLGFKDPDFLGKLKNAWDLQFKTNPKLILIICGSISSWIEKNIMFSTGFVGRISLNLRLTELSLPESNMFWQQQRHQVTAYEKFKILSVTGGVPRYLEEIIPSDTAEDNIKRICFNRQGFLFSEFEQLFFASLQKNSQLYQKIVLSLINGPKEISQVCRSINHPHNSVLTEHMYDLELAGFIIRDYAWHLKNFRIAKISRYRILDNYLRFYLKYILPNKFAILKGLFEYKNFCD